MKKRCAWCASDPLYVAYHDDEWGVPVHDDRRLLEFLILEGAQAGLSWLTILRKRENYRKAFHGFDCERIARYSTRESSKSSMATRWNGLKLSAKIAWGSVPSGILESRLM